MNNYTQFKIDSLAQLPEDCDLAPFVGFTLEEAVHHVVVPAGAVPHAGRVL